MARKYTKDHLKRIKSFLNDNLTLINFFGLFGFVGEKFNNFISNLNLTQYDSLFKTPEKTNIVNSERTVLDFFNLGTIEMKKVFDVSNQDLEPDDRLTDDEINKIIVKLLLLFGQTLSWYTTYVISNNEFFLISNKAHDNLKRIYYSPSALLKKNLDRLSQAQRTQLSLSTTPTTQTQAALDDNTLTQQLLNTMADSQITTLPQVYLDKVKSVGTNRLIANQQFVIASASLVTLGMTEIFRSLYLSQKVLDFLKTNNVSLNLIQMYEQLVENPALFFELRIKLVKKLRNAPTPQDAADIEKELNELNNFIKTFNDAFANKYANTNTSTNTNTGTGTGTQSLLAEDETNWIQLLHSFAFISNEVGSKTTQLREHIVKTLSDLSNYLFPVYKINYTSNNTLETPLTRFTTLQLQNVFFSFSWVFTLIVEFNEFIAGRITMDSPTGIKIKNFFNTFCDYEAFENGYAPEGFPEPERVLRKLAFLLVLSVILRKRITSMPYLNQLKELNKSHLEITNTPASTPSTSTATRSRKPPKQPKKIVRNDYPFATSLLVSLPILSVPLTTPLERTSQLNLLSRPTPYLQTIKFPTANFFIINGTELVKFLPISTLFVDLMENIYYFTTNERIPESQTTVTMKFLLTGQILCVPQSNEQTDSFYSHPYDITVFF